MNVLVDTSVWVSHFRDRDEHLIALLQQDRVLIHPMILGEIACGTPPERVNTLADLSSLRYSQQPTLDEVMTFVEQRKLYGMGCGLVDMVLLASAMMTHSLLWTHDKRLARLATALEIAHLAR
ncbi:PIN domain-containing protein [Pseudomonas sp. 3A(2025)]